MKNPADIGKDAFRLHQFDVVIPKNGNEHEFIEMAISLGYSQILFLTSDPMYIIKKDERITIKKGYMLKDVSEINRARHKFDYLFAPAERKFFEQKVDFIIDSELSSNKDSFHFRTTSLNQVHAELVQRNNISLVIGFGNLFKNTSDTFGKMMQNSSIIQKYGLKTSAFSMANDPSRMRSRNILDSLLKILGL